MKNSLSVLCCLISFQIMSAQSVYRTEYQQKWSNSQAYTMELAEAMPESAYDYKPTEDQMSFKEQLLHICSNMAWLSSTYLGGEKPAVDLKKTDYTKAQLLEILEQHFIAAAKTVEAFPMDQLEDEVKFFAGPMSKRQILVLMNDHVVHHRGQLIIYARMNGVKPPGFRGW